MSNASFQKQINTLSKDISNLAGNAGALVVSKAGGAKDLVVDRGGDMLAVVSKAIKKNPLAAVGIAFGVGVLAMGVIRFARAASSEE